MTENVDAYYTLEELFILTDILEDKTYDLRYWENIELIVSKLNRITGNAIRLQKENEQLKRENEMLKVTIGRNEAYINQLTHKEKWTN